MDNELKTKSNMDKIYIIIALIIAILGAVMIFKPNKNETTASEVSKVAEVSSTEVKEDAAVARIDINTKFDEDMKPLFEVYVDDSETPVQQAGWMQNMKLNGYTVQKEGNSVNILIKILKDADLSLALRGPNKRGEDNASIPVWVKYTSVIIDGNEILPDDTYVWHNKPFRYKVSAKAGSNIKLHAEWMAAEDHEQ